MSGQPAKCHCHEDRWDVPSDDKDAPDSLNSSPPICIGKTRSCGRIWGIFDIGWSSIDVGAKEPTWAVAWL